MDHFLKIDTQNTKYISEFISENFDNILSLLCKNSYIFSGAINTFIYDGSMCNFICIVAGDTEYRIIHENLINSLYWIKYKDDNIFDTGIVFKQKSIAAKSMYTSEINSSGNISYNRIITDRYKNTNDLTFIDRNGILDIEYDVFINTNNTRVILIYAENPLIFIKETGIKNNGIVLTHNGILYETIDGAQECCKNKEIRKHIITSRTSYAFTNAIITAFERSGWKSFVKQSMLEKVINDIRKSKTKKEKNMRAYENYVNVNNVISQLNVIDKLTPANYRIENLDNHTIILYFDKNTTVLIKNKMFTNILKNIFIKTFKVIVGKNFQVTVHQENITMNTVLPLAENDNTTIRNMINKILSELPAIFRMVIKDERLKYNNDKPNIDFSEDKIKYVPSSFRNAINDMFSAEIKPKQSSNVAESNKGIGVQIQQYEGTIIEEEELYTSPKTKSHKKLPPLQNNFELKHSSDSNNIILYLRIDNINMRKENHNNILNIVREYIRTNASSIYTPERFDRFITSISLEIFPAENKIAIGIPSRFTQMIDLLANRNIYDKLISFIRNELSDGIDSTTTNIKDKDKLRKIIKGKYVLSTDIVEEMYTSDLEMDTDIYLESQPKQDFFTQKISTNNKRGITGTSGGRVSSSYQYPENKTIKKSSDNKKETQPIKIFVYIDAGLFNNNLEQFQRYITKLNTGALLTIGLATINNIERIINEEYFIINIIVSKNYAKNKLNITINNKIETALKTTLNASNQRQSLKVEWSFVNDRVRELHISKSKNVINVPIVDTINPFVAPENDKLHVTDVVQDSLNYYSFDPIRSDIKTSNSSVIEQIQKSTYCKQPTKTIIVNIDVNLFDNTMEQFRIYIEKINTKILASVGSATIYATSTNKYFKFGITVYENYTLYKRKGNVYNQIESSLLSDLTISSSIPLALTTTNEWIDDNTYELSINKVDNKLETNNITENTGGMVKFDNTHNPIPIFIDDTVKPTTQDIKDTKMVVYTNKDILFSAFVNTKNYMNEVREQLSRFGHDVYVDQTHHYVDQTHHNKAIHEMIISIPMSVARKSMETIRFDLTTVAKNIFKHKSQTYRWVTGNEFIIEKSEIER
jgi:hypothetical protein